MAYALDQIKLVDPDYPDEIDYDAPLKAELLTGEDMKLLAPKKRVRGPAKASQNLEAAKRAKKDLLEKVQKVKIQFLMPKPT